MKQMALLMIVFYQKHISPHKGFSCAYHQHTGHASCSNFGYRAIRRFGVFKGIGVLRMRFSKCDEVYKTHYLFAPKIRNQAGYCELPCTLDTLVEPCVADACANCNMWPPWGQNKKMGPDSSP